MNMFMRGEGSGQGGVGFSFLLRERERLLEACPVLNGPVHHLLPPASHPEGVGQAGTLRSPPTPCPPSCAQI